MTDPRTHLAENLDLFRFGGDTFDWARDNERLGNQLRAVLGLLLFDPRRWWTLAELSRDLGYPEASISARLRDCRKLGYPAPPGACRQAEGDAGMSEFCVTTVIEFEDGSIEGQVLHEGDRESCEKLLPLLSAISVSDGRAVKAAGLQIVPRSAMGCPVGQTWRYEETQG